MGIWAGNWPRIDGARGHLGPHPPYVRCGEGHFGPLLGPTSKLHQNLFIRSEIQVSLYIVLPFCRFGYIIRAESETRRSARLTDRNFARQRLV